MLPDFTNRFIGGAFIAAALMGWLGWLALPVKIGTFFDAGDFGRIYEQFHLWIWLYRIHLFGLIVTGMALVALALVSALSASTSRVLIWPGAVAALAGLFIPTAGQRPRQVAATLNIRRVSP